ncbi:hypothetical protein LUZ61_003447 [Rhynchospora tenuis]|uniref:Galactinol--sucrose galactosyltransferase n=1 Tax=Rhynchospora tenuis TaxID=198213 RepID=A0AAD5ZKT3_9POAL|nr:hypothetical protein LUZ61_003447 [Rhynchospora tenuis]
MTHDQALKSGSTDELLLESKIEDLRNELDEMVKEEEYRDKEFSNPGLLVGLKAFIQDLRTKFGSLDDVYVWQALCGYWGGIRPGATKLDTKLVPAKSPPGLDQTMIDSASVNLVKGCIGLVDPDQAKEFYDLMHSHLAKAGVTGVKMDVINSLEFVSEGYGGQVELAKIYYQGLTQSIMKNFNGTGAISSMQQCNDFIFLGTQQISMGRAGDDFWVKDPHGDVMGSYWLQGAHMVHCAYNSLWLGQVILPDWDMFRSDHVCSEFHAASRAICGGPIYVSDPVGSTNFDLLRKLVFSDGTVPKCIHCALPTRDCLFKYPLSDSKTMLKIWNLNKFSGVIGAFNCQGAGWDPKEKTIRSYPNCYIPVSGRIHKQDIEWDQDDQTKELSNAKAYAVYLHKSNQLLILENESLDGVHIDLKPSSFEILTFVPLMEINKKIKFAPVGLVNMFNSGGTVVNMEIRDSGACVKVKGEGELLVFSSERPWRCMLNGIEKEFDWHCDGRATLQISWDDERGGVSEVYFGYKNF